MASETFRICDRCGARHKHEGYRIFQVQKVEVTLGTTLSLARWAISKELCQPCREKFAKLVQGFFDNA